MPSVGKTILALVFVAAASAFPTPQLAGEGAAANSIFSSTDNGIGYGIKNAEENLAGLVTSLKGGAALPPAPAPARRQLDKVSDGFQVLSNAIGTGGATKSLTGALDTIDGDSTSGAANIGADAGALEEGTLEGVGSAVPRL